MSAHHVVSPTLTAWSGPVYAYLRTIPPITNHVPDPIPPPGAAGER